MAAAERVGEVGTARLADGTLIVTEKVTTIISQNMKAMDKPPDGTTILLDRPVWAQVQKTEVVSERVAEPPKEKKDDVPA